MTCIDSYPVSSRCRHWWADDGYFYIRAGINVADIESRRVRYPLLGYDSSLYRREADGGGGRRSRRTATEGLDNDAGVHWVDVLSPTMAARLRGAVDARLAPGELFAGTTPSSLGPGSLLSLPPMRVVLHPHRMVHG